MTVSGRGGKEKGLRRSHWEGVNVLQNSRPSKVPKKHFGGTATQEKKGGKQTQKRVGA